MAARGKGNLDDLSEPDYDFLSFGYSGDEDDDDDDDYHPKKPGKKNDKKKKALPEPDDLPYILGTLIVRVVAARDLQPAKNAQGQGGGGLGDFLFGGHGGNNGSANPYASVKFGTTTQRTSEIYGTVDPVWPRGETMFMDVSLPTSKTTHPDHGPPPPQTMSANNDDPVEPTPPLFENEVSSISHNNPKNNVDDLDSLDLPSPILTLAVFSASEMGKPHKSVYSGKYPNKGGFSGDSDDEFLGMASVDLTCLLTGKQGHIDCWLPLSGGTGAVRIACEYETTDCPPRKGDLVKFTRFCHPADLYPLVPGRMYPVQEVIDKDHVLLSYTSPEGWICSFMAHRFMLLCVERHHGAVEAAREEWQSLTERLSHSPLVGTVSQTVERLPEDGLIAVGANIVQGSANLLGRWLEGGFDTAIKDVAFATNWDGRFNPGLNGSANQAAEDENNPTSQAEESGDIDGQEQQPAAEEPPITLPEASPTSSDEKNALPGMPNCPITNEPMVDPVVAADGHSYERAAIARWLQTSDKSPLTGLILPHKELVPNYGLLSSLQEQADARKKRAPQPSNEKPKPKVATELEGKPPADPVASSAPVEGGVDMQSSSNEAAKATEVEENSTVATKEQVTVAFIDGSDDESSSGNQ